MHKSPTTKRQKPTTLKKQSLNNKKSTLHKKKSTKSKRHFTTTVPSKSSSSDRDHFIDPKPFYDYKGVVPQVTQRTFVANTAKVIGNVTIGKNSCVLDNVIIRGDNDLITIGNYTNIQEGCVLHVDPGNPIVIGDYVTIGHGAVIHGCKIASNSLIGMGAIIMNGAEIGENTIVGANAMVPQRKIIPANSLLKGSPAKAAENPTTEADHAGIKRVAMVYADKIDHFFDMKQVQPKILAAQKDDV